MEIIRAENISKIYQVFARPGHRLAEWVTLKKTKYHEDFYALKNISFRVNAGEALGVIGGNGAGKSTLLRILAGISAPTTGDMHIRGNIATLLDLAAGFKPQFTGRENIKLNCTLVGMHPEEIKRKTSAIIEFAELAEHIDHKLFTYSSGMAMRLGFAIAANMDAEIFLIDEVIAVGDEYFQRKCVNKIENMRENGKTIVLVSHNLHAVKNMCSRALWLEKGEVHKYDNAEKVIDEYVSASRKRKFPVRTSLEKHEEQAAEISEDRRGQGVNITRVRINGMDDTRQWVLKSGEPFEMEVTFDASIEIEDPVMGGAIFRDDGVYVYGPNTMLDNALKGKYKGVFTYTLRYDTLPLLRGKYFLTIAIFDKEHVFHYVWLDKHYSFTIEDDTRYDGLINIQHSWDMRKGE